MMAHFSHIRAKHMHGDKDAEPAHLKDHSFFGIKFYKDNPRNVKKRKPDEVDFYSAVKQG